MVVATIPQTDRRAARRAPDQYMPLKRVGNSDRKVTGQNARWRLHRCREDLVAEEEVGCRNGATLPPWARALLGRSGGHGSLVEAAETAVAEAIDRAEAICRDAPPPVRLTRVAERLGVTLQFVVEEGVPRFRPSPDGPGAMRPRWARGAIAPDGTDRWILQAGSRSSSYTRQIVAHELGHALLFHGDDGIDLRAWRATSWSDAEETLVNYIARVMLAPADLVPAPDALDENISAYVVGRIASLFRIPHRVAAVRALDLSDQIAPRTRAFVMWRQYHPFSDSLIERCFRPYPAVSKQLRAVASHLRSELLGSEFNRSLALWTEILHAGQERDPWAILRLEPAEAELARRVSGTVSMPNDPDFWERVRRFTEPTSRLFFRPEWVVWRGRPAKSFVPERRGGVREGSLVAGLAGDLGTVAAIREERVEIGDLVGDFRVHAYAHGEAREGSRFVLTALEEVDR